MHQNSPDAPAATCDECDRPTHYCDCRSCVNPFCTEWLAGWSRFGHCEDCRQFLRERLWLIHHVTWIDETRDGIAVAGGRAWMPLWVEGDILEFSQAGDE